VWRVSCRVCHVVYLGKAAFADQVGQLKLGEFDARRLQMDHRHVRNELVQPHVVHVTPWRVGSGLCIIDSQEEWESVEVVVSVRVTGPACTQHRRRRVPQAGGVGTAALEQRALTVLYDRG
jgi:hypothetical protein